MFWRALTLSARHLKGDFIWNGCRVNPTSRWPWKQLRPWGQSGCGCCCCPPLYVQDKVGTAAAMATVGRSGWSGNNGPTTRPLPEPHLTQRHGLHSASTGGFIVPETSLMWLYFNSLWSGKSTAPLSLQREQIMRHCAGASNRNCISRLI